MRPVARGAGEWTDEERDREMQIKAVLKPIWDKRVDGNTWGRLVQKVYGKIDQIWRRKQIGRYEHVEGKLIEAVRNDERTWLRQRWKEEPDNMALREAKGVEAALVRRYEEKEREREARLKIRRDDRDLRKARRGAAGFVDGMAAFIEANDRWPVRRTENVGEFALANKIKYYLERYRNGLL